MSRQHASKPVNKVAKSNIRPSRGLKAPRSRTENCDAYMSYIEARDGRGHAFLWARLPLP
ncbi:hypothetical protein AZA_07923 [Nitrospirillum viridazoti Y2]|nr:hypothetical protein AZA_07923 [Nitrospirillum amazonense Y2]